MLEQRAASRLMRTAEKVGRTIHLDRNLLPIVQSNQRVDAVPGDLATMLVLNLDIVGADFSHHIGLQLRRRLSLSDEGVKAGLAQRVGEPWPQRSALFTPERPLMQLCET